VVILKPSGISPIPGERPWLLVRYFPFTSREHILEIPAPGKGGAYLLAGPAMQGTYNSALSAYFGVNFTTVAGMGQIAIIDFDRIGFHGELEELGPAGEGASGARLTLRLTHSVRVFNAEEGELLEDIPLDVSVDAVIEYSGMGEYLEGAESLAGDLFLKLEKQLFQHLVESGEKGMYIYHSGSRTVL
jgi:hypothetical protein